MVATVIPQVATVGPAVRNPLQDQLGMDDQKFASLMQRQQEWERAGVEGGMRSRTDPVMAAFQEQRAAQVAANPPAVAAVQVAVAPVTPAAPAGPTEPPKPLREQLGHMDDTQYAALMQRQQEWERAGVEGGMRSRTDPVMAAVQERRATEVAALAGIQTFSTTAGDGTVITAKQAPQTMGVNSDQMAFQAMMAKMLDNDNCVSMQGSGKMGCSALAQAGLGNAGVMVADPASGRESPVQTANAFLQKLVAGGGPEVQQQQIIKRPEMTIA